MKKFLLSTTGLVVSGSALLALGLLSIGICWAVNLGSANMSLDNDFDHYWSVAGVLKADGNIWGDNEIHIHLDQPSVVAVRAESSFTDPEVQDVYVSWNGSSYISCLDTTRTSPYWSAGDHTIYLETYQDDDDTSHSVCYWVRDGSYNNLRCFFGYVITAP
jgi:hypothetical protein